MGRDWDWDAAATGLGLGSDGGFNCGNLDLTQERALIWRRGDGSSTTYSGAELSAAAGWLSAALVEVGVEPGTRVAGVLGRRPEALLLALAAWRIGAIYVPLFSGFGSEAMRVRLADSGAAFVVTDQSNRAAVSAARDGLDFEVVSVDPAGEGEIELDALLSAGLSPPPVAATGPDTPATIMYTSGTTGTPKGCVLGHKAVISLAPFVRRCLDLRPGEILFSTADTGWSFGLYTTGIAPIAMGGCRLLYEGDFDAREWMRIAQEEDATHFASAPTGYRQIAAAGEAALPAGERRLKRMTSAGEALDAEVVGWFEEQLGITIHDAYGLTELGMVAANPRAPEDPPPAAGSMGVALPGFELAIFDGEDKVSGAGSGRLAVAEHKYMLGMGYWDRPDLWEARRREGWWLTEDLVRRDEDGRLWHAGRADDIIVTAGYNVSPVEVENALMAHPALADVACVEVPDPRKGAAIAAHAVLAGEVDEVRLLRELRDLAGARLGWHAAPRHLRIAGELPRTESGKLRRGVLRDRERGERPGGLTHIAADGSARMVDVGAKLASRRRAVAAALVRMTPGTAALVAAGDAPKGDVIGTARLAGIQAAKRTDELIPLAHSVPLSHVDLELEVDQESGAVRIEAAAATVAATGVEMEALTACAVAALTIYDMVKGVERGVHIERIELVEKTGGKHDWRRDG